MNDFKLNEREKITTGFTTPDNYFENFTQRLMQQLPVPEVKVVPLYMRKPVWFSAAAGFIIMLTVGVLFATNTTKTAQPDDAAIEHYLVYDANVNSYDLMQNLDQQDIDKLKGSIVVSDDALKDYLTGQDVYFNE